jgi:serine/threonine-protein kinase
VGPWAPQSRSEDARSFYQERLRFFAKAMVILGITFLAGIVLAYTVYPQVKLSNTDSQNVLGICTIILLAIIWRRFLTRTRTLDELFYIDAFVVILIGVVFGIFCFMSHPSETNMWSCFIWMSFTVFSRVLYVPSTPRRTFVLSILAMGPLALAATLNAILRPEELSVPGNAWAAGVTFYSGIVVVLSTVGSRVIYGLRKQVRDAQQLGQYTLGRKIGEGGMGAVYEAHHALLRRPTAIKLLPPDKAGADDLVRFEREVQITAELTHPNTVAIFDYGRSSEGVFYYAMEYLDGVDLDTLVHVDGPQTAQRVVHILLQAAGALEEAHKKGLIHRDIKPANILLCERGGVPDFTKVVDFGLVKVIADSSESTGSLAAGTPAYISPEAVMDSAKVGPPSDIYGLGAVGYYLLSGRPVFEAKTAMEMCVHHARTQPPEIAEQSKHPLSPELAEVLMTCLKKNPKDRPQTAAALRDLLVKAPEANQWSETEACQWWRDLDRTTLPSHAEHTPTDPLALTIEKSHFHKPGDPSILKS